MDDRRLRYFLAVVDEGSVTRAAQRLHVAQPSLSQALRAFESELEHQPGILECTLTTGRFDYELRVACRDQSDLVRIVEYLRTQGGAAETYSRIVLRQRRFPLTSSAGRRRRTGR